MDNQPRLTRVSGLNGVCSSHGKVKVIYLSKVKDGPEKAFCIHCIAEKMETPRRTNPTYPR